MDLGEVDVAVKLVCRPGVAIGVAVGGCLAVGSPHVPLSHLLLLPPRLRLIWLTTALLLVLPLFSSRIMLTDCREFGTVVLIVAKLVAVMAICGAEALSRCLHSDAASRNTS